MRPGDPRAALSTPEALAQPLALAALSIMLGSPGVRQGGEDFRGVDLLAVDVL
jgi:hypothetical protein